jgi:hypothetical protein
MNHRRDRHTAATHISGGDEVVGHSGSFLNASSMLTAVLFVEPDIALMGADDPKNQLIP